jgi:hypothetical protein
VKIHYISPYSYPEKNIGGAINDAVRQLNASPDDWIVHMDMDAMWLLPDSKAQVERILSQTSYDVLGCMTNRVGSAEQLVGGYFNEDDRIRNHIDIARHCRTNAGDLVKRAQGVVAAFMMCFRMSAWQAVGGFVEDVLNFDTLFCWEVVRVCPGGVGIMQGVYVFHQYRLMSTNPRRDARHLMKTS